MPNTELSEQVRLDLIKYIDDYSKNISESDIEEILKKFDKKLSTIHKKRKLPDYAKKMISQAKDLVLMLESKTISSKELDRVIAALHYLILAEDIIPDYTADGYLDDAFVISTVHKEVRNYL